MENEKILTKKDLTYKPKKKNSYVIANAILESICYHNKLNEGFEVSHFKDKDFYNWIDGNEDIYEVLNKSKDIHKESTRIIRIFDLMEYQRPKYKLSVEKWFNERSFSIQDNNVLKELSQILLYYVGNCEGSSYTTFFEKLDFLIEYVIKPALEHNDNFEKERYVIDSINNFEEILILDENDNEVYVVAIKIKLSKIVSNKVEKILVYESNEDVSYKEISIDRVVIKEKKQSISGQVRQPFNSMLSHEDFTSYKTESVENPIYKEIDVILECDTVVYEYFQIKPLKEMKTFATEDELKEFYTNFKDYKPKENKFYIIANDTEEMILSTVLHCLPHSVILENDYLNKKLIQKFKDYAKGANIEICPPSPTEPSSDSKNESKKEDKKTTSIKPKRNISKEEQDKLNKIGKDLNKDSDKLF